MIRPPIPTGNEVRNRIIAALRHGALALAEISTELDQPPFRIRAELKELRRDRLVTSHVRNAGLYHELTAAGHARAAQIDQGRLL